MREDPSETEGTPQEELELEPVRRKADWVEALGAISLGGIVLGGVGLVVLAGATPRHTMGATLSAQLEWERRQVQIEADLAKESGARRHEAGVPPPSR
jgi:hypothetical protein